MIEKRRKFGEELAQQRTSKGVSLEEMAKATKIRKPVLQALEAGRFEELPPDVFAIGFLKVYAERIGVNPEQLIAQYKRLQEPEPEEKAKPSAGPSSAISSKSILWGLIIVVIALGGLACLIYKYETGVWPFVAAGSTAAGSTAAPAERPHQPKKATSPLAAPAPSPGPQAPAPPSGQTNEESGPPPPSPLAAPPESSQARPNPEPSAAVQPPQSALSPAPTPAPQRPSKDLVLNCTQSCWVELWADGKRVLYRQVAAGENLAFDGQRFRFNIGNASGLQVTWKGHVVTLPASKGRVVKNFFLPPQSEGGAEP